jgi:hypothetical protein
MDALTATEHDPTDPAALVEQGEQRAEGQAAAPSAAGTGAPLHERVVFIERRGPWIWAAGPPL